MRSQTQNKRFNNSIEKIKSIIKKNDKLLVISKKVKTVFRPIFNILGLFVDLYTIPHNCPKTSIKDRIIKTAKYRLASLSLPISENEKRLSRFRNLHRGERCFIIGNGPSLNKLNLKLLKNEFTIGVNAIYTNYEKMGFFPTYYVVEDVFVAEDRADEINNLKGPKKFFGNYLNYCLEDNNDVNWLNVIFRYDNYKDFPNFSKNALRRVWTGGTVTYICLQLAFYMGFDKVYLIGFDHNYSVPKEAVVEGNDILSTTNDPNHFSPDYFGKGKRWHDPMVDRMGIAYKKANRNFLEEGKQIYNATAGGKLEVFKRVDYFSLFDAGIK